MKLTLAIGIALTMAAVPALAQCPGCPKAPGSASMSTQAGGLADLKLVNLTGESIDLSQHIGMMPMVVLLAGTGEASGRAADVVQAAFSNEEPGPMLVYVLASGPKAARAFAKSHTLTGLVLVDQKRTALAAAMADTLPVALFIDRSGNIVKAEATITEATLSKGVKALAQNEQKLVDPVCRMSVTKETAAGNYSHNGKTYYFCSKACQDNFTKDPQKYLSD